MRRSSTKLPNDPNQRAIEVVAMSLEQSDAAESIRDYLSAIGRKGGLKGGKARAKKLSASKRSAIARNAAKAMWLNRRKKEVE
jgi:hypothetical protein